MLVGTAIAVSTGRIADPTRTILPYLGRNCDSVKAFWDSIAMFRQSKVTHSCISKFFVRISKQKAPLFLHYDTYNR